MTRYYWDREKGDWTDQRPVRAVEGVQLISDLKPFKSPLEGHKVIDGRAALREELKINNCRIVDPQEWHGGRPHYINETFTKKRGLGLW